MIRRHHVAAIFAVLASSPILARADHGVDVARADALFNAGKVLRAAGQYADACVKFAESKRAARGVGITLHLADCYERQRLTASAWREFRDAQRLARDRDDPRAGVAAARAEALEPRLNRLTIQVLATSPRDGLQVLRDGESVAAEVWNLAVPVDPGDHVVVVSSPGRAPRTFHTHLDGEALDATVQVETFDAAGPPSGRPATAEVDGGDAATAPLSLPTVPTAEYPRSDDGSVRRGVAVGLVCGGAIAISVGTAFAIGAASPSAGSNSLHTVSTLSLVGGATALLSGMVLYLTAPSGSGVTVSAGPSPGGGGLRVRGSF